MWHKSIIAKKWCVGDAPYQLKPAALANQVKGLETLSEREIEVLELVVSGISNADIAARLFLSINTVKKHITNIFNKLGVKNRLQAVEKARQLGLIE